MCDRLKLNLGSFCHLMMNDWTDPAGLQNEGDASEPDQDLRIPSLSSRMV
jgi:hypothetical protein